MVGCLLLLSRAAHIYHIPTFPLQWPLSLLFVDCSSLLCRGHRNEACESDG